MTLEICSVCGEHTVGPMWIQEEIECAKKMRIQSDLRDALSEHPGVPQAVNDPTHGRIDKDIQKAVDQMNPTSTAQRVAMENTLQEKRDRFNGLREEHAPHRSMKKRSVSP